MSTLSDTAARDVPSGTATPARPAQSSSGLSTYYVEIFLVSFAALLLEISYTRIISFKLFYYFTYLVIGLALLGMGAGGVFVVVSGRLRRSSTDAIVMVSLFAGAILTAVSYLIVAATPINTQLLWDYGSTTVTNGLILFGLCVLLFVSFVPAGIILSTLFGRSPEKIGRLYFADLAGAAIVCAIAVSLIASIGPPATVMLASFAMAAASVRTVHRVRPRLMPLAVVLMLVLAVGVVANGSLPDVRLDGGKTTPVLSDGPLKYSSWSPVFRVDVRQEDGFRALFHDGLLGSEMLPWDGKTESLANFHFERDPAALSFSIANKPPDHELIIGAAAGHEVLASLYFGSKKIDAVELNPVTYKLVTKTMADYDGHLAQNPAVHYVNGDGRSYLARSHQKYDLIWYVAPDSYSASNASSASAFVLSESYLYTRDAIESSLKHLAKDGLLINAFGDATFYQNSTRTARYVQTALAALRHMGIQDPERHIMVSTSPMSILPELSTIVVKATPFTADEIAHFQQGIDGVAGSKIAYAPGQSDASPAITRFINPTSSLSSKDYPYSVGSITDNKPFFFHFKPFMSALGDFGNPIGPFDTEVGVGERALLLLLVFVLLLSVAFLLAPFFAIRKTWQKLPSKGTSALYFIAIGFGFIFFEITLIQKLVLFLGYPTYSLTVTLSSLLIFVGIGSLLSRNLNVRGPKTFLMWVPVVALTAFYLFGITPMTDALLHWPLAARIPITFLVMAPLGLCLGIFMPMGVRAVASLTEHSSEYVAWGWALNGFASVVGSVLATIVAMTYGFPVVLLLALLAYLVACSALYVLSGRAANTVLAGAG